jgi:hypothetical protein
METGRKINTNPPLQKKASEQAGPLAEGPYRSKYLNINDLPPGKHSFTKPLSG